QAFIAESRRAATHRRHLLSMSLLAGLIVAVGLAGVAYWQERGANEQRQNAETTLAAATETANRLIFDLASRFRDASGVPTSLIKDMLDRARELQEQLMKSGQVSTELRASQAGALMEVATTLLAQGDTRAAFAAANRSEQILQELMAAE